MFVVLATVEAAHGPESLVDLNLSILTCALVMLILLTIADTPRARMRLPFRLALTVVGLVAVLAGSF